MSYNIWKRFLNPFKTPLLSGSRAGTGHDPIPPFAYLVDNEGLFALDNEGRFFIVNITEES